MSVREGNVAAGTRRPQPLTETPQASDLAAASLVSDSELVMRTRQGDRRAFGTLYARHLDAAWRAATLSTASAADAEDAVAEGFARVFAALPQMAGRDFTFRPYLLACVRNAAVDRHRRTRKFDLRDKVPDRAADGSDPDEIVRADFDRSLVGEALQSLPERWRTVLWLTEVEGMTPIEAGAVIGIGPNAVSALAYRARNALRQAYLQAHLRAEPKAACRSTADRLAPYVRFKLAGRERAEVQAHLDGCATCRQRRDELFRQADHARRGQDDHRQMRRRHLPGHDVTRLAFEPGAERVLHGADSRRRPRGRRAARGLDGECVEFTHLQVVLGHEADEDRCHGSPETALPPTQAHGMLPRDHRCRWRPPWTLHRVQRHRGDALHRALRLCGGNMKRPLALLGLVALPILGPATAAEATGAAACTISGTIDFVPSAVTATDGQWRIEPAVIECRGLFGTRQRMTGPGEFSGSGSYRALPSRATRLPYTGTGTVDYRFQTSEADVHLNEPHSFVLAGTGVFSTPTLRGTFQIAPPPDGDCLSRPLTKVLFVAEVSMVRSGLPSEHARRPL